MEMTLFETAVYVHPKFPVEFLVAADGKATRVAIEWSVIERLMGTPPEDEDDVREFLHRNRKEIALAIEAHMFAQGVPLSRHLVMSADDFDVVQPMLHPNLEAGAQEVPRASRH